MIFAADGQLSAFLIYFAVGFSLVIPCAVFTVPKGVLPNKITEIICDICSFLVLCAVYFLADKRFAFGEIRVYSVLGVILGAIASGVIFYKPLAKLRKIVYNISQKIEKRFREKSEERRKKGKTNGKGKSKKVGSSLGGVGGGVPRGADGDIRLSDDLPEKAQRRIRKPLQRRAKARGRARTA